MTRLGRLHGIHHKRHQSALGNGDEHGNEREVTFAGWTANTSRNSWRFK